jgi:hypothetical protein
MSEKVFKIHPDKIKKVVEDQRGCVATDKITVEGMKVGFMYREAPDEDIEKDSGWRFFSGTEDQDYVDDYNNSEILTINTIANYDPAILPYLKGKTGSSWEREEGSDKFVPYVEEG